MWKSNLIIALRVLGRNKAISLINVVGLSAALAVVVLCLLFVRHETSYDSWHEKRDRIFLIYLKHLEADSYRNISNVDAELRQAAGTTITGIRESVYMHGGYGKGSYRGSTFPGRIWAVDPAFLTLFTLPLAAGDAATALDEPHSVVLAHKTAQKYFGPGVAPHAMLGERIRLHSHDLDFSTSPPKEMLIEVERTITGVLAPLPGPTILSLNLLVPAETADDLRLAGERGLFIELEEGLDPAELETRLASFGSKTPLGEWTAQPKLLPFKGAYFGPSISLAPPPLGGGKIEHCYLLAGLAAVVLLIAAINFVNLALGRAMTRTLEVGLRKAIGATRPQLSNQFLAEAILVSLIAVAGGVALAQMLLPSFNRVVHRQLELEWLSIETWTAALTLALWVGVLSGLYPAQIMARLNPVRALFRKAPQLGRGLVGRGLVIMQFALSSFLVVVTITVERQGDFMRTKDLGFDGDQVVVNFVQGGLDPFEIERLASEINSRPGLVEGVAGTDIPPGFGGRGPTTIQLGGESFLAKPFEVGTSFLKVMGIDLISGRNFVQSGGPGRPQGILINETAARLLGPKNPVGTIVSFPDMEHEPMPVIGIVEDFHYEDMRQTVGPAFLTTATMTPRSLGILFRLDHRDLPGAVAGVRELWKRVLPEYKPGALQFLDEAFARRYETERRVGIVLKWVSAIALIISCMGLLVLAALAAARRTREISIRKVLGATTGSVLMMMSREFGWLVVAANAIAWPAAFFVLDRWLAFYAYRIDQSPEWFALAGAGVLVVALATVSGQTWLAARTNPADALRYE